MDTSAALAHNGNGRMNGSPYASGMRTYSAKIALIPSDNKAITPGRPRTIRRTATAAKKTSKPIVGPMTTKRSHVSTANAVLTASPSQSIGPDGATIAIVYPMTGIAANTAQAPSSAERGIAARNGKPMGYRNEKGQYSNASGRDA